MKNLAEKALLVNLCISQWTGRAYDEEVTMQVERDHSAHNAGRYTKLLIDESKLKGPQKAAGAARKFYYTETLPWTDNGDRLLPATNYLPFMQKFHFLQTAFDQEVDAFVREYPYLKVEARTRLNTLFSDDDYPDVLAVRAKFRMKIGVLPISDLRDFRLRVSADEVSHLRRQMEQEITERISGANRSLWERVRETITRVVERLSQQDAVFRNSLIGNIQELVDLIPRLNFTDDDNLLRIVQDMKPLIVDPEDLRTDTRLRHRKAEEAAEILTKVNDFLS